MANKEKSSEIITSVEDCIKNGNIIFYEYRDSRLPEIIYQKDKGTTRIFLEKDRDYLKCNNIEILKYKNLLDISEKQADIFLLDKKATKVLLSGLPIAPRYFLIRLTPCLSWLISIPGLIRRILIGFVAVEGIVRFEVGRKKQSWLVVRNLLYKSINVKYSISSEIGVQGFLDYLHREKIKYVVLRFYSKLPELNRRGGDLDILVTDQDEPKVQEFLWAHPGTIGVDIYTPLRKMRNGITYYPPPLARKIIASAVDGPSMSKIPSPEMSFLSFIYHVIYHKGISSGVPTYTPGLKSNQNPENDYKGEIKKLAKDLNVNIDLNLEALDHYLHKIGWRPKYDTLSKMILRNEWIRKYFFQSIVTREIGLGVFILKKKVFDMNIENLILKTISDHGDFKIIRERKFNEDQIKDITDQLRGGVWDDVSQTRRDFLPAMAVIVLDVCLAKSAKVDMLNINPSERIGNLKKILRKKFDTDTISLIHSTDFTHEAWEYIRDCFPKEEAQIRKEVESVCGGINLFFLNKVRLKLTSLYHQLLFFIVRLKSHITTHLIRWLV